MKNTLLSPDVEEICKEKKEDVYHIVLYNDNNTFEHVILCLIEYCKMDALQAEQISIIVDSKGKCEIKSGSFETLKPICEVLLENKLSAKIE